MSSAALAASLVERGLDPSERHAKEALFEQALARFSKMAASPAANARVSAKIGVKEGITCQLIQTARGLFAVYVGVL